MTKQPPYQPTTAQMLAQAQATRMAQQQTYLQQAQLAQAQQQTGVPNGGHWYAGTTASGSSVSPTYITYMGTGGTVYSSAPLSASSQQALTIEEAGIRAGEIIGYRAWYLRSDDVLWSMYVGYAWQPGTQRITDERLNRYQGNGFHAFKDMDLCQKCYPGPGVVFGEVALWGEVYEHERGYRAECARITRLIGVWEDRKEPSWVRLWRRPTIHKLREKYGVIE